MRRDDFSFTKAKIDFKDFLKKVKNHPYYKLGPEQTEVGIDLAIKQTGV